MASYLLAFMALAAALTLRSWAQSYVLPSPRLWESA